MRIGEVRTSPELGSSDEVDDMSFSAFPRVEDLPAPPLKFLAPLELIFINDYRNVPFGRFLRSSYDPAMTRHQHRMIRA